MNLRQDGFDSLLAAMQQLEAENEELTIEEIAQSYRLSLEIGDTGSLPFELSDSTIRVSEHLGEKDQRQWVLYAIYTRYGVQIAAMPRWSEN